jgi:putative SOS response-associated peptidase YedK
VDFAVLQDRGPEFLRRHRLTARIRAGPAEAAEAALVNLRPTDPVPVLRDANGLTFLRWGLRPPGLRPPSRAPLINARGETVHEKPSFAAAFRSRRCLLPATHWFEWATTPGREGRPYCFRRADGAGFCLAGIWESRSDPAGHPESCALITCAPNRQVAEYHDRMPVLVAPEDAERWLAAETNLEDLRALLRPCPEDALRVHRVTRRLGVAQGHSRDWLQPVPDEPPGPAQLDLL